jgi:ribonuclease III
VKRLFEQSLQAIDPRTTGKNPKTLLQELLQGRRLPLPRYAVVATSGEAHEQMFQVECSVAELGITSRGEGSTRQSAEQDAARRAYELAASR